jgi:hypothetical protein
MFELNKIANKKDKIEKKRTRKRIKGLIITIIK